MKGWCNSCTAPLDNSEFKGPSDIYCRYCSDEAGKLKPRDVVKKGIAGWLKSWAPDIDDQTAMVRAEHFMKAMPAWAEK